MTREKILLIRFSSFGDIFILFPAISYLLKENTEVHVLTKEKYKEIFEFIDSRIIIHTISDHAGLRELFRKINQLKEIRLNKVYDLHRNLRSLVVTWLLGVPYSRVSKHRLKEYTLYLFKRKLFRILWGKEVNRKEESLKLVGCQSTKSEIQNFKREVFIQKSVEETLKKIKPGYVCLNPDSAWKTKMWGIERFQEVQRFLLKKNLNVVWLGEDETLPVQESSGVFNFLGRRSISELGAMLKNAKVLVCNDAGLMHLSETVGTPVVSIFGPTSKELGFAPVNPKSSIVESNLWCRPCSKTGKKCFRLTEKQKCLSLVSVDMVLNELAKHLESKYENLDL